MAESPNISLLLIGYGSDLRGDDAAGRRVADAVAAWNVPGVRAMSVHQLTPELAEEIAAAERVVFVDAKIGAAADEQVQMAAIEAAEPTSSIGHTGDPRSLLALAKAVFGRCPPAWLLTVPGAEFGLSERLSSTAERGVGQALEQIRRLLP